MCKAEGFRPLTWLCLLLLLLHAPAWDVLSLGILCLPPMPDVAVTRWLFMPDILRTQWFFPALSRHTVCTVRSTEYRYRLLEAFHNTEQCTRDIADREPNELLLNL
jgi:hypothetical protein